MRVNPKGRLRWDNNILDEGGKFVGCLLRGNREHAAKIDGAFTAKTWGARRLPQDEPMLVLTRQPRTGEFRGSAAEGNDDGSADSSGEMHWTGIVREDRIRNGKGDAEFAERSFTRKIVNARSPHWRKSRDELSSDLVGE